MGCCSEKNFSAVTITQTSIFFFFHRKKISEAKIVNISRSGWETFFKLGITIEEKRNSEELNKLFEKSYS